MRDLKIDDSPTLAEWQRILALYETYPLGVTWFLAVHWEGAMCSDFRKPLLPLLQTVLAAVGEKLKHYDDGDERESQLARFWIRLDKEPLDDMIEQRTAILAALEESAD